jgi:hypothetical protein
MTKQELISIYSNYILDIIEHKDEFTTSDLQGAIEAQIIRLIQEIQDKY